MTARDDKRLAAIARDIDLVAGLCLCGHIAGMHVGARGAVDGPCFVRDCTCMQLARTGERATVVCALTRSK